MIPIGHQIMFEIAPRFSGGSLSSGVEGTAGATALEHTRPVPPVNPAPAKPRLRRRWG
jgi:hypothetical protein